MSRADVVVIGGGVIGLSTALQLSEAGSRVTVLDRGEMGHGCSFGNAGLIPPSYCEPIATPEGLAAGLRGLIDPRQAVQLRIRGEWSWLRWVLRFLGASRWDVARAATRTLRRLCAESLGLYSE